MDKRAIKSIGRTKIEWATHSWNAGLRARHRQTGKLGWHCEHVSEECRLCYAETINGRFGTGFDYTRQNRESVEILLDEDWLRARMPRQPARIFVADMTDLYGEFVTDAQRDRIFQVFAGHPQHVFMTLTKRPEQMGRYLERAAPLPNLWCGVSCGEHRHLGRLDVLRQVNAVVRFVSLEPLLDDLGPLDVTGIDWAIVGGESGSSARLMDPAWAHSLRDQCGAAGAAFFMKQMTKRAPIPADLLVREFPSPRQIH